MDIWEYKPPTRKKIISHMEELVKDAKAGDSLFVHCKFIPYSSAVQRICVDSHICFSKSLDMVVKRKTKREMNLMVWMRVSIIFSLRV